MTTPRRLAVTGVACLAVAAVAWTVAPRPAAAEAETRRRITAMTQTERDELQRRATTFQALPLPERDAIERLHAAVTADSSVARGLEDYLAFVRTLEPWDRQALADTAPAAKADKAATLAANRDAAADEEFGRGPGGPVLPAVALERALAPLMADLPAGDESLPPPARHAAVLAEIADRAARGGRGWPDEAMIEASLAALPEGMPGRRLIGLPPEFRRPAWEALLMRSVVAEWRQAVSAAVPEAALRTAVDALPPADRLAAARGGPERLSREAIVRVVADQAGPAGDAARGYRDALALQDRLSERWARRFQDWRGGPPGDRDRDRSRGHGRTDFRGPPSDDRSPPPGDG